MPQQLCHDYECKGVFDNLKNEVNIVQSKTNYTSRYKNEIIFF